MFDRLRFHVRSHACFAVLAAILITMWLASAASASPGQRDHSRHAHSRHSGQQIGHQPPGHRPGHGGPPPGQKGPGHGFPQASYLALGDSLAFGYSQAKFESLLPTENPAEYNTGYVDDFAHLLRLGSPKLQVINDGCPGETTESFIKGPCEYQLAYPLHHPYVGGPTSSQLSDALAYLQANPNTNPITLDIGANDALGVIEHTCEKKVECVIKEAPALFAHITANLGLILGDLRAADPHATIIVLGLYNPFGEKLAGGDALTAQLNEVMSKVAATVGARFADPLPVFNPPGKLEEPTICLLTNMCNTPEDIHPTDLGYRVLAGLIAKQYFF
ncbi:MAG TPA: SGNH/GDSL hydrolase family protein [Solirubrobacteraceae bacterium]|jgi:lysophospholipase L1-like esterase|nr:SGNH/GDSL hydrolase family protein [Solirubrobacteraceae bacterium]